MTFEPQKSPKNKGNRNVNDHDSRISRVQKQTITNNRGESDQNGLLQRIAQNNDKISETYQLKAHSQRGHNTDVAQRKENKTGLPDDLKSGMENLSGMSLDDVKVHTNSSNPAQFQAHAYAQGSDIHLGPGQEKHLPHELGHVVQQKQGRVQPTKQLAGKVNVNDDAALEKEADTLGSSALKSIPLQNPFQSAITAANSITQLKEISGITAFSDLLRKDPNASSNEGKSVYPGAEIKYDPDQETNNFYKSKFAGESGWLFTENVVPTEEDDGLSGEDEAEILENLNDSTLGTVDLSAGLVEKQNLKKKENGMQNDKGEYKTLSKSDQALSRAKGGMDAAVGVGSSIVGLVGMVQGFRGMLKEGSVWDKAMAGEGFLESTSGAVGGIAKSIDAVAKAQGGANTTADTVGKVTEGITSSLSAIKNAFTGFYHIYKAGEKGDAKEGLEGTKSLAEAAKNAAEVAKTAYDIIGTGIPTSLLDSIPGLSIAISVIDIMIRAADFYGSGSQQTGMKLIADNLYYELDQKKGAKLYRIYWAGTLGFKKKYNRPKESVLENISTISKELSSDTNGDQQAIILQHATDPEFKKFLHENGLTSLRGVAAENKFNELRILIHSHETADKLCEINNKRKNAAGTSIAVDIVGIAADIMSLTPAALGGVIIKGAIAAGKAGVVVGKYVQDSARNKAGSEHGSDEKTKKYVQHIRNIFELFEMAHTTQNQDLLNRAKAYLSASGVKTGLFYAEKSPHKQAGMLLESMRKR